MKKCSSGKMIALVAGAAALIGSILYIVLDGSDRTFHMVGFLLGIAGAVCTLLPVLTRCKAAPLVPTAFYAAAFGLVLRVAVPSLSDVWNHVNFIGGNAALGMTFAGVYFVCAILGCVSCFLGMGE